MKDEHDAVTRELAEFERLLRAAKPEFTESELQESAQLASDHLLQAPAGEPK